MSLSAGDQDALLQVVEDFFCSPLSREDGNSDVSDDSDAELDLDEPGT